jgi:asparagine synthase (glutamine-hydrolysing)
MCTKDGRYWIVHNGEVYNFREIRKELETKSLSFESNTDTEVILKAYTIWGPDCVERFNGMWAFAIWDNLEKTLFCSRDRIGIKPFYYYHSGDYFLFASDIKTLIASGLYEPEPDWEGVYHAMSFYCAPRPLTCFKGIRALEQGHYLIIDIDKKISKQRYWQMPVGEIDFVKTENQWKEELEAKLRQAVRRRLVADVPVGTFMSGGVDSTTVSAFAAQEHPGIKAFTLGFQEEVPEMDEVSQAKATAKMWPMEHVVEVIQPETTLGHIPTMVRCYEEPFYTLAPNYMISELVARNGVTVILNGLGGDELFCGYGREKLLRLWHPLKRMNNFISSIPFWPRKLITMKALSELKDVFEYYVFGFSIFTENEKKGLFEIDGAELWNTYKAFKEIYGLETLPFRDAIEAICYMDIINYIGNHHVYRVDQFTMHFSIEGRFPFLDHELVELACHMPSSMKVRNGMGKYILKEVSKDFVHPSCISMKKIGFGLPVAYWMRNDLKGAVSKAINELGQRDVFRRDQLKCIKQAFYHGKLNYSKLWLLVMLEYWLKFLFDDAEVRF